MTLRRVGVTLALLVASWCGLDVRAAEAQCTYSVSPTSVSASSTGLNSSIGVTTGSSCAWTPVSTVPWITITSGGMSGLGSFSFSVAVNGTGSARTGTMTVGGQTVTVNQSANSCTYSVSPMSVSALSTGLNSSIGVTTGSSCAWTPVSTVPWITITSPGMSGLGSFNFTVAANTTGSARTGTMTVGGQTVTVTQSANSCTYSVSPMSVSALSTGLNSSIGVTTGSSCAWTPVSTVTWITITSPGMSGLGSFSFTVAANTTGSARTGTMTVGGQTVTVNQSANSCTYSVSPMSVSALSTGLNSSIGVTTGSSCAWTPASTVTWITITSPGMSGLGSFDFTVAANTTGSARTGTMTVGGQTVTVNQSANSCTYSVSPMSVSALSTGLNSSIGVTTGSSCAWTPVSTVTWITITSPGMSGLGSFDFTVAANTTGSARTGTMTVGGQTVTVNQSANSCTYSVSPTTVSAPSTGLNSSIGVTTGSSCAWTPVSTVAWITITSPGMSGLGSFNFTVAANGTASARTGTMTVGGQTVTVTQATGSCTYSASPTSVSAPSTGLNSSIGVTTGSSCAWTPASTVTWITITSPGMSGLGSFNFTVAANGTTSPRTGSMLVGGQVVSVTQAAGSCTYSASPTSVSAPSTGLSSSIGITTGSSCAWTPSSTVTWITITSPGMSGLGSFNFTVAANATTSARTGTMTVGGQTVTVNQAAGSCTYSVSPTSVSAPSTGLNSSIGVTTGSSCAWTPASTVTWITITSPGMSGLGSFDFTVAANATTSARTGTMTVGGQTVTVNQAAGSCTYSVSPTTVSAPSTGLNSSIGVTTGSSCAWTPASTVTWITITSPGMSGLGSFDFTVAANATTSARTGTMTVGGQTVTVNQAAGSCTYSVSPTTVSAPSTGLNSSIGVTTGSSCAWTPVSTVTWITITSPGMSGLGSFDFTVAANATTSARTGTMTVGGQTVTVNQAAGSCTYSVSPTTVSAPSTGLNSSIGVTTGSSCAWTPVSTVTWITITSPGMSGLGSFNFTVAANTTTSARTGTMTVGGQTVTVNQAAGSCTYSVTPTTVSAPSTGLNSSIGVTTGSSCAWTPVSTVTWITITSPGMSGLGSFNFTVAANTTTSARTGTMTVGGQTVTVNQAAGSCTYSVTPTTVSAPSTGLNSSIGITTGSSCAWTPVSTVTWITITSPGMSGLGSFNFTVAANATTSARTGTMTVGGQTVTINQDAPTPPAPPAAPPPPSGLRIVIIR